jgi:hypothetical protein
MGQLAANIRKLAEVPSRASTRIAGEIAWLIDSEFAAQSDPYGNAWEPHADSTVERWGPHPILTLSGDMRGSVDVQPMRGSGVSISIDHPAAPHQTGWSGPQGAGPARPILPSGPMPAKWREAIDGAIDAEVRKAVA